VSDDLRTLTSGGLASLRANVSVLLVPDTGWNDRLSTDRCILRRFHPPRVKQICAMMPYNIAAGLS
jgi:hypothetical protein